MKPIYKPKGKAAEYGDYCINIYTGCNHGCTYCYAPRVLRKTREAFEQVRERPGLLEAMKKQLSSGEYNDKLIHLCFTCDPYPAPPVDTMITREVIKAIKDAGAHVQILTKGGHRAMRDFDLMDSNDWFGVTITGTNSDAAKYEPNAATIPDRVDTYVRAHNLGIKTWISCEPVFDTDVIYDLLFTSRHIDLFRIGKLNYHPSEIDWAEFGSECERLCKKHERNYMIKFGLRIEMEK